MTQRSRTARLRLFAVMAPALVAAALTWSAAHSADGVATVASASNAVPRGFVYRVSKPGASGTSGKALYLYGTLHIGRSGGAGLDEATRALVLSCPACRGRA